MPATLSDPVFSEAAIDAVATVVGGRAVTSGHGPAVEFDGAADRPAPGPALVPLTELGVLKVSGADAVAFLHGQLTNDLQHLAVGVVQRTGYCSAKGRLLATALAWRSDDAVWLVVSRPLAEPLRKRLTMFVLRAKAKVENVSDAFVALGLIDVAAADAWSGFGCPTAPEPMRATSAGGAWVVGLPAASGAAGSCAMALVPIDDLASTWTRLAAHARPASPGRWRLNEVLIGVPRVVPATVEAFVPQMVNFELVDGVNFKKGCYPGQEVVARSQYLGKLRRRMFAGRVGSEEPQPGADVVTAGDPPNPVGTVVMSAPAPEGGFRLLFEAPTAAVAGGALVVDGQPIELLELPYAVPVPASD